MHARQHAPGGAAARPALYCGYSTFRNVAPGASTTTAMCVGGGECLESRSSTIARKPCATKDASGALRAAAAAAAASGAAACGP